MLILTARGSTFVVRIGRLQTSDSVDRDVMVKPLSDLKNKSNSQM